MNVSFSLSVFLYGNRRFPIWELSLPYMEMHLPAFENTGKHKGMILNILYPMC